MAEVITSKTPEIKVSDISGLWEVLRIDEGEISTYPWIRGRFMFDFLEEEMMFVCFKEGKHLNGTWELSEKTWESETQFSIILNEEFEYIIVDIDEDEMIITDRGSKYFLTRKL